MGRNANTNHKLRMDLFLLFFLRWSKTPPRSHYALLMRGKISLTIRWSGSNSSSRLLKLTKDKNARMRLKSSKAKYFKTLQIVDVIVVKNQRSKLLTGIRSLLISLPGSAKSAILSAEISPNGDIATHQRHKLNSEKKCVINMGLAIRGKI